MSVLGPSLWAGGWAGELCHCSGCTKSKVAPQGWHVSSTIADMYGSFKLAYCFVKCCVRWLMWKQKRQLRYELCDLGFCRENWFIFHWSINSICLFDFLYWYKWSKSEDSLSRYVEVSVFHSVFSIKWAAIALQATLLLQLINILNAFCLVKPMVTQTTAPLTSPLYSLTYVWRATFWTEAIASWDMEILRVLCIPIFFHMWL